MRTTHGVPCACELARYVVGSIPLDTVHMFGRMLSFSDYMLVARCFVVFLDATFRLSYIWTSAIAPYENPLD